MRIIIVGWLLVGLLTVACGAPDEPQIATRCEVTCHRQVTTASDRTHRLVWENSERLCRFIDKGEDCWAELDKDGNVFLQFKELRRNCDFVELFDHSRGYIVRIYEDALFIKGGNDGFHKFEDFTLYYEGLWVR